LSFFYCVCEMYAQWTVASVKQRYNSAKFRGNLFKNIFTTNICRRQNLFAACFFKGRILSDYAARLFTQIPHSTSDPTGIDEASFLFFSTLVIHTPILQNLFDFTYLVSRYQKIRRPFRLVLYSNLPALGNIVRER